MIAWNVYAPGKHRITCFVCGCKASDKTLGVLIEIDGKGVAHCFRCNFVETHRPDAGTRYKPGKLTPKTLKQTKHETLSDYGLELWDQCQPLAGVALAYLKNRKCFAPKYGDLRYHPAVKHPSGYTGPALVALITDIHTNKPLSLHRTWITATGKADVQPVRMLLGNHSIINGVIRLTPDDEVNSLLGIAEGIETALSLALAPLPVWATIDAGHLSKFHVLNGIQTLVIAQDKDPAGIAAASTCAARWAGAGKTVYVTNQTQNDLNDVVMEAACYE